MVVEQGGAPRGTTRDRLPDLNMGAPGRDRLAVDGTHCVSNATAWWDIGPIRASRA